MIVFHPTNTAVQCHIPTQPHPARRSLRFQRYIQNIHFAIPLPRGRPYPRSPSRFRPPRIKHTGTSGEEDWHLDVTARLQTCETGTNQLSIHSAVFSTRSTSQFRKEQLNVIDMSLPRPRGSDTSTNRVHGQKSPESGLAIHVKR
jgi:hypothetical protein